MCNPNTCARYFGGRNWAQRVFSSEWPKHHLLRESAVKKCYMLGYIHNSTNNKVWSTKARAAKKFGRLLGIHKRSLFYDMVYDGRTSGNYSGPLCSSLEVGMLSDKVVRTSFFTCLCCRGRTGISCHWGGSPGCLLTGVACWNPATAEIRGNRILVKSLEWEAVGSIPLLNVPAFLLFVCISVVSKMQNQDSWSSALNTTWQIRLYFDPCIPDCMMPQFLKEGSALWLCLLRKKSNW